MWATRGPHRVPAVGVFGNGVGVQIQPASSTRARRPFRLCEQVQRRSCIARRSGNVGASLVLTAVLTNFQRDQWTAKAHKVCVCVPYV